LWQPEQVPVTWVWSNTAFENVLVVWQSSQLFPLVMWFCPLPGAVRPLWQLAQEPMTEK